MAIQARFQADFSSFTTAVSAAKVKLKDFETDANKVQASVQKIGDSFGGKKIIQDAELTAKAIAEIGGASKLTAAEQSKVNATVTEAIAKYAALGKDAPKALTDLAAATTKVEKSTSGIGSVLQSTFGQFTLAGLASSAISKVTDEVGQLIATGLKLPALDQSFKRLTGSMQIDGQQMLANMSTSTKGMVANYDLMQSANKAMLLGLPVTADAMGDLAKTATTLGKAMGQDATTSLNDLITALGRSSPMILDNLGLTVKVGEANEAYAAKLGKTAEQLTDAEKKTAFYGAAMDAARKKTKELGEQTQTLGEFTASVWTRVANAVTSAVAEIDVGVGRGITRLMVSAEEWERIKAKLQAGPAAPPPAAPLADVQARIDFLRSATQSAASIGTLTAAQREFIKTTDAAGKSVSAIAAVLGVSEKSVQAYVDANKKATEATKKFNEERAKYSGAAATADLKTLDRHYRDLANSGTLTAAATAMITDEALNLYKAGGTLTPELQALLITSGALAPTFKAGADGLKGLGEQITVTIPKLSALDQAILKNQASVKAGLSALPGMKLDWKPPSIEDILKGLPPGGLFAQMLGSPAQMGQQISSSVLAAIQGGGNPVAAAAGSMGTSIGSNLANMLKKDGTKMFTGALGGIFSAALPVVGGLIGPLADMIMNKLFGSAGRDKVKDFAASFGGFDALHVSLNALGAEGETLWIKLTQGVGKNNPAEAEKAIAAITAALEKQKLKTAEVTAAAEASAAAQIQATDAAIDAMAAKYQGAFDMLDREWDALQKSVAAEAAEAVMGTAELQERARMAQIDAERRAIQIQQETELAAKRDTFEAQLAAGRDVDTELRDLFGKPFQMGSFVWPGLPGGGSMPSPPITEPTLPPGTTVAPPAGRTGGGTAMLVIDGRTLAEVVVPNIPGVVTRYGLGRG